MVGRVTRDQSPPLGRVALVVLPQAEPREATEGVGVDSERLVALAGLAYTAQVPVPAAATVQHQAPTQTLLGHRQAHALERLDKL